MNKLASLWVFWIAIMIMFAMMLFYDFRYNSERDKRVELEAQLDNLTYQLEDEFIGFLITKPPLDSLDVNIHSITIAYSLGNISEVRTITIIDTVLLDLGR